MIYSMVADIDMPGPLPWLYFDMREGVKLTEFFLLLSWFKIPWGHLAKIKASPIEPDLK